MKTFMFILCIANSNHEHVIPKRIAIVYANTQDTAIRFMMKQTKNTNLRECEFGDIDYETFNPEGYPSNRYVVSGPVK